MSKFKEYLNESKNKIELKHISTIKVGDTVEHDGVLKTVGKRDIKKGFMGVTLFGDSYKIGKTKVKLVTSIRK